MSVIYLLISISIIVAAAFLYAFLRAVKTGQYDDDYTPSVRMLFDDELIKQIPKKKIEHRTNNKEASRNLKPETQNPKPETQNSKPKTRNPKQYITNHFSLII